jgi:hypothetical protein
MSGRRLECRSHKAHRRSIRRQYGWGASEYLSVLVGLMVVWWGAQQVLAFIQEHHDEFTWALMMPI